MANAPRNRGFGNVGAAGHAGYWRGPASGNQFGGVGSAGSALLAPAPGQPAPAPGQPAPAPAPAAPPPPPVAPFLTPDQQRALDNWNTQYGGEVIRLNNSDTQAWANFDTRVHGNQHVHDVNQDMSNQNFGARGLFESSIRDNALNDLASTLVQQNNIAQTARDTQLFNDQQSRETLAGQNTANQNYYAAVAVENAQGIQPTPNPTPAAAAPAPAPAAAAPAAKPSVGVAGSALTSPSAFNALTNPHGAAPAATPHPGISGAGNALMPPGMSRAGIMSAAGIRLAGVLGKPGAPR